VWQLRPVLEATLGEAAVPHLADVFISYARTDEAIARNLAETLRSEGFDVWFDAAIYAGANWEDLLMGTLGAAKAILILWSKRSVDRPWVLKEARIAMDSGRLVPVRIDDCQVPAEFDARQIAIMPGWNGAGAHPELSRLLTGLSKLAPPSRIDNVRPGFNTAFLGPEIELPAITGVAEEFRYLHFSVVMNPARRLAWYVAYNMRRVVEVQRGDRWMPDPMLPATFQPANEHYAGRQLDRGHIARPRAVSWGTEREARIANRQSFFWTNTAPQYAAMNRGWWLKVEQWEEALVQEKGQAAGFSGPVLSPDDPPVGELEQILGRLRVRQNFRLPRKYWKLVVVAGPRRRLSTAAFLVDQHTLQEQKAPSDLDPATFQTTVKDLEAETGLDFGERLRKAAQLPL
jgi:DNA/RNA endonuclease G (NUC1)